MFARSSVLSLVFALFFNNASGLDLDVNDKDSITSVVKSLASGIVTSYKTNYEQTRIPGLFDDDLYYWWQAGNTFTELIEYAYLTGDTQYNSMISKALQHQLGDFEAFMPPNQTKNLGNEDQSYWALASLTAHEAGLDKPEHGEWIDFAVNAFNTQIVRWDQKACNGGLRWQIYTFNNGYNYRNSGTNGNFFLLATRLAHLTGNSTYSDWAAKSFDWSKSVGLISDKSYVFDGTDDVTNCSTVNKLQWTNNHAIYTEGAALMYNATNGSETWAQTTRDLMNASSIFTKDDVLVEVACERNGKCDTDQRAYKSGAIRSYARAALVAPFIADSVHTLIEASAKGAAKSCEADSQDVKCNLEWTGSPKLDTKSASDGNLGEVTNALSAVKALLWSSAKPFTPSAGSLGSNSTNGTGASGNSGAAAPENTGAAGTIAASAASALIVAFAAALVL